MILAQISSQKTFLSPNGSGTKRFRGGERPPAVPYAEYAMKRNELARELARTAHLSTAAAQDHVDELVHEILRKLRAGEPVDITRLGKPAARTTNGK
jgi:hypothetical protein